MCKMEEETKRSSKPYGAYSKRHLKSIIKRDIAYLFKKHKPLSNCKLLDLTQEIGSTLNMILLRLNILEVGPALRSNVVNDDKIRDFIPLLTTEDLLQLEELLNNDEDATQQLVYKFNQIGGKNEQDFIRRALSTIFDNKLATMCSWTVQKNNFRIKDCAMIKVLKNATRKPFPNITDLLFEKTIMDWFRHAKQRLNRDT